MPDRARRIWPGLPGTVAALTVLGLAVAGPALASGGTSIANAPTLQFGMLTVGGGVAAAEYWRLPVFAGDKLTVRSDNTDSDIYIHGYSFEIYAPNVDDFRIGAATPVNGADNRQLVTGKTEFTLTVPFSGLGTLAICKQNSGRNNCAAGYEVLTSAYSYTITDAHATSLTLSGAPRRVRHGQRFKISARVQSPAGIPAGDCLFQPIGGHGLRARGPVALVGGSCSATVPAGTGSSARYRVSFQGADGWQDATGLTRSVAVQKRSYLRAMRSISYV